MIVKFYLFIDLIGLKFASSIIEYFHIKSTLVEFCIKITIQREIITFNKHLFDDFLDKTDFYGLFLYQRLL